MSHLRNVALYCNRHLNTTGSLSFLLYILYQLLRCVWYIALSYMQSMSDFPPFLPLLSRAFIIISHPNKSCWPPYQTRNFPLLAFTHSFSVSIFLFFMQTVFLQDNYNFCKISPLPLNRTIIYLCMYNENEFTLLISSRNKHSKRLH